MTLPAKQLRNLKTELNYSKIEHLLSAYYEEQLAKEVSKIFQEMEYRVINNLAEYYNPEVMFKAHTDLILAPIHEMHKHYYELLCKYKIREFDKSRAAGKRIVERMINFRRRGNILSKQYTVLKADLNDAVSSTITKDKLFGTLPDVHENLETRTYQLSEKTLARVDDQINDIIVNGYEEGMGIDKVSHDIRRRFGQLKTWESVRIARTEIHNSQCLGIIKGYEDMGVEYIQWSTARDSRVRGLKPKDSADHIHMEGEIIRMGGVFSNGLMYPGDMNGAAAEIINCRCQALPFIIPYGYIAPPDMAQFKEDDLIATLDYFNADDIVEQAMAETTQIPQTQSIEASNELLGDGTYTKYKDITKYGRELDVYKFKNIEIGVEKGTNFTMEELVDHINVLPPDFIRRTRALRINLYKTECTTAEHPWGNRVGGLYRSNEKLIEVFRCDRPSKEITKDIFNHEYAHSTDVREGGVNTVADPVIYEKYVHADNIHGIENPTELDKLIYKAPSKYAAESYIREMNAGKPERKYTEDIADSVKKWLNPNTHQSFVEEFPNRTKYFEMMYGKPDFSKIKYDKPGFVEESYKINYDIQKLEEEYEKKIKTGYEMIENLRETRKKYSEKRDACETDECYEKWDAKIREVRVERKRLKKMVEDLEEEAFEIFKVKLKA